MSNHSATCKLCWQELPIDFEWVSRKSQHEIFHSYRGKVNNIIGVVKWVYK